MDEGTQINASDDASGFRDMLDGRPIHAGDALDLWVGGAWVRGHYESNVPARRGLFVTTATDPAGLRALTLVIDRPVMLFRWPDQAGDRDDLLALFGDEQRRLIATRELLRLVATEARQALAASSAGGEPYALRGALEHIRDMITVARILDD